MLCAEMSQVVKALFKMSENVSYATFIYTLRRLFVNGLFVRYFPKTNTYVDQSHSGNFLNQFKYKQPVYVFAKQPADKQTGT